MAERLSGSSPPRRGRRLAAWAVLAAVLLAHALVTEQVADGLAQWRRGDASPPRIQVAFVRELKAAPPPVAAPAPAAPAPAPAPKPPKRRARAPAVAAPASAPPVVVAEAASTFTESAADADAEAAPAPPASQPEPQDVGRDLHPQPPRAAASQPAAPPASQPAPGSAEAVQQARERFEWPPSTRLAYHLSGNYRGPVEGTAQVEWIHVDGRFQVHLDVLIGPEFAPLVSRRMSSEGVTGPTGLVPQRYDEETKTPFRAPRRASVRFEDDRIVLTDRPAQPPQPGVQDTASQFVQLTWLFITNPALLAAGTAIEFPLALPRRVERWTYQVADVQTLYTAIGPIEAVHVTPRRPPGAGGDLTAEIWVAPTLQYLPVRIRLRQDEDTYVDLLVARPPMQASEPPAGPPPPVPRRPYSPPDPTKDLR